MTFVRIVIPPCLFIYAGIDLHSREIGKGELIVLQCDAACSHVERKSGLQGNQEL
jgi:hypothetical protein